MDTRKVFIEYLLELRKWREKDKLPLGVFLGSKGNQEQRPFDNRKSVFKQTPELEVFLNKRVSADATTYAVLHQIIMPLTPETKIKALDKFFSVLDQISGDLREQLSEFIYAENNTTPELSIEDKNTRLAFALQDTVRNYLFTVHGVASDGSGERNWMALRSLIAVYGGYSSTEKPNPKEALNVETQKDLFDFLMIEKLKSIDVDKWDIYLYFFGQENFSDYVKKLVDREYTLDTSNDKGVFNKFLEDLNNDLNKIFSDPVVLDEKKSEYSKIKKIINDIKPEITNLEVPGLGPQEGRARSKVVLENPRQKESLFKAKKEKSTATNPTQEQTPKKSN